jgi:hypothetical protein
VASEQKDEVTGSGRAAVETSHWLKPKSSKELRLRVLGGAR